MQSTTVDARGTRRKAHSIRKRLKLMANTTAIALRALMESSVSYTYTHAVLAFGLLKVHNHPGGSLSKWLSTLKLQDSQPMREYDKIGPEPGHRSMVKRRLHSDETLVKPRPFEGRTRRGKHWDAKTVAGPRRLVDG